MAKFFALLSKYAWVPIPLFLIAIVIAKTSGLEYARENTLLLLILNLIFNTFASLLIIYLISRSFLVSGRIALVLFNCAALAWGFAGSLSAIFGNHDPNTTITIYNLSICMAAIFYLSGAYTWSRQKQSIKFPGIWLTISFSVTLIIIAFIVILAISGNTPLFFIEHEGGTPVRYYVLILSIVLFISTAILLSKSAKALNLTSLKWYSIALGLLSIGLFAVMLQHRLGDFLNWTGRSAQFLGGAYMIVAAFALVKETNVWELSIEFELNSKRNALRKKEERYRQIVELAGEAIVITDEKFIITEWNRAAETLYGWTAKEVIGKRSQDILRSNIQGSEFKQLLNDLAQKGIVFSEVTQQKKDNSTVLIESRLSVIKENNIKISGYIAMNRDITERKKAEQQLLKDEENLKHAKDEIERSHKRLDIALENANIGLWEWDFIKNELIWDERSERMFGLMPGTFGKTLEAFEDLVNEEDLPRLRIAYKNSIEKGVPYESVFRIRASGNPRYISSKAFVVRNQYGNPQNMMGVCFDVTAFREDSDKAILKLNEELSRSNRDLENFAYVASHDLQEPLRMVTSFTQLLQKRYTDKLDDDANVYINYAVEGSKRMYELLNGLLEYSRIRTRGKEFAEVDMNNVLRKVKANLRIRLDETQAVIDCTDLPGIMADENQMIQIMQNLIDNGLKFAAEKPEITVTSAKEDGFVVFSVRDKGIGIEPQYHERIFRIFQRLHPKDQYGGMGIGLSICQRIIERHGGKIWVESTPGNGSVFHFSIPEKVSSSQS